MSKSSALVRCVMLRAAALLLCALPALALASADTYVFDYKWRLASSTSTSFEGYTEIHSGDFDGDGLDDIVVMTGSGFFVSALFFFQREDGLQPEQVEFRFSDFSYTHTHFASMVGDVDGDGRSELLVSTSKGLVIVWVGADRSMRSTSDIAGNRTAYGPAVVADVDNDGHPDIVLSETSNYGNKPSDLVIRYGDGAGGFPRTRLIPTGDIKFRRLEVGDLNGDGHLDLVAINSGMIPMPPSVVGILYGDGRGGFHGPDTTLSGTLYLDVLVGDMNNDGRDDLLKIAPWDTEYVVSVALRSVDIHYQEPDGSLPATPVRLGTVGLSLGYDLVDLDGDGQLDLVTLTDWNGGKIGVHLQRDGRFTAAREFPTPYTTGYYGALARFHRDSHAYGDFNNDGVPDIVYTGGYGPVVVLTGRLRPYATDVAPPGPPRNVTVSGFSDSTMVTVDFEPPLSDGGSSITHYEVLADPDPGIRDWSFNGQPLSLSRIIRGQNNGERYRYRVRAYNAAGPGPLSEPSPEFQVRSLPALSGPQYFVFEPRDGVEIFRYEFHLTGPALEGGVTFDVATRDVTATAGLDYGAVSLTGVTIPEGSSHAYVDVPIHADDLVEEMESFELVISNVDPSQATHRGVPGLVIIRDPRPEPTIASVMVGSVTVLEGNTGTTAARFPITLTMPSSEDVSFDIRTQDGTARAGVDYVARATRIVIPAGTTTSEFIVQVIPDLLVEPDRQFTVFLDNESGGTLAWPTGTGTILDDDSHLDGIPEAIGVDSEKGYQDLEFSELGASGARFSGTAMVVPAYRQVLLGQDPTPTLPLDSLTAGVTWTPVVVPANALPVAIEVRVLAMGESSTARRVSLYVGEGSVPSPGSVACAQEGSGRSHVCELVLRREPGAPQSVYWAAAQNREAGTSGADMVQLEVAAVAMVPVNKELVVSGPGALNGSPVLARVGWDIPGLLPGQRRLGYLIVESALHGVVYHEPFRLHRTGELDAPHVLAPGERRAVSLAVADAHERMVFDVPANAASVTFTMEGSGEVSLFAAHDAAPTSPVIVPAPPRVQADRVSSLPGANQSITLSGTQLKKGRWYLTPVNRGADVADVIVRAEVVRDGPRPSFRPGHYFNPDRPGHGLFLDFAGDQWVMVWYTYLQDGTPTWYYTQGPTPADDDAQWPVELFRVSRGGLGTRAVRVGSATLSILEGAPGVSPKIAFGYNLDGDAGWELLTRLGDDACPIYGGQKLDASGHWYAPVDPGYGFSVQILPNTEIYAAYIYDGFGFPRWLIGQKDYNERVDTVTMQQLQGFCPTCPLVPLESKAIATLTRTLGTSTSIDGLAGIAGLDMSVQYAPPLAQPGFSAGAPVFLLSARKGCD